MPTPASSPFLLRFWRKENTSKKRSSSLPLGSSNERVSPKGRVARESIWLLVLSSYFAENLQRNLGIYRYLSRYKGEGGGFGQRCLRQFKRRFTTPLS